MVEKLSSAALAQGLAMVPNWSLDEGGQAIARSLLFASFSQAFGFMARVALAAEKAGHHPQWSNIYASVSIRLTTHDAGGLTQKDFDLAQAIDQLVA